MKKLKLGIVAKTLLAFSAGLIVLTISLTTATMAPLSEGFEAGGKTSYAAANVTLGTGSWYMDDALTGNLSTDRKTGAYSARVRNTGLMHMNFNKTGAGTVSIQHAVFSTDGPSSWQLWFSTNNGSTWTQVGSTVTTSSTTLQTATFTVNNANAIRFEIRKVSGGANRINLDNVQIGDFSSPTPTPTPTPSEHLTMGNPSNAVTNVLQPNNYLMDKPQYSLSYSRDNGGPNWVSWHLDGSWLGSAPRQDDFRADTTLPTGWYRVQSTDYSGSGFDRGHMCPSADRTVTVSANSRSEEHTSELQSQSNLVCRLLLEKKKKKSSILSNLHYKRPHTIIKSLLNSPNTLRHVYIPHYLISPTLILQPTSNFNIFNLYSY